MATTTATMQRQRRRQQRQRQRRSDNGDNGSDLQVDGDDGDNCGSDGDNDNTTTRQTAVYIIPKGHYVLACPAVSQVDKSLWFKPEEWIPSRWTNSEGQAQQAFEQYAVENGEKVDYGFGALGTLISTVDRNVEMRILTRVPPPNYHTMISTLPKQPGSDHRKHEGYEEARNCPPAYLGSSVRITLGHQNRVEMVYVNSQTNSNQPPPPKV
ncbi:hypothetical protein EDB85DRAFT_2159446 [Lactarius pseudohatsudake]|nr:hypothetical protein EDB85DRAFT_2159446 [Lactarius pseudohatsudake]